MTLTMLLLTSIMYYQWGCVWVICWILLWIGKISGYQYPETLGQIHFWLFFIGVNLTFFPMHFLRLAGMPRRIPDYPDAFAQWNVVCSYGSYLSILASIFFFYVVFKTLGK